MVLRIFFWNFFPSELNWVSYLSLSACPSQWVLFPDRPPNPNFCHTSRFHPGNACALLRVAEYRQKSALVFIPIGSLVNCDRLPFSVILYLSYSSYLSRQSRVSLLHTSCQPWESGFLWPSKTCLKSKWSLYSLLPCPLNKCSVTQFRRYFLRLISS